MNLTYTDYGIANRYGDDIELNVNLKKYPDLHNNILRHELKHDAGKFTIHDFNHDLTDKSVNIISLMKFIWKHPKSLTQFLPVYKHKSQGWVYDSSLLIIYSILSIIILLSVYFGIII